MAISERERRDIFNGFEQTHGEAFANTIMELLPNQPADQLVTRTDMHAFGTGLRGEMAELRAELKGDMAELRAELRTEMGELRTELKGDMAELRGEMAELRAELKSEMGDLRSDMIQGFAVAKVETNRIMIGGMVANAVAVITALIT